VTERRGRDFDLKGAASAAIAVSFAIFAILLRGIHVRRPQPHPEERSDFRAARRFVRTNRPIRATTVMFMLFNLGFGEVIVLLPVYTREVLDAGSGTYGLLLASLTAGELIGSFAVGAVEVHWPLARTIAATQLAVGGVYLAFAWKPGLAVVLPVLVLLGALTAPLTIWAQTLRMREIPAHIRGRVFALLRTAMQGTTPAGSAISGPALASFGIGPAVVAIATCIGLPGGVGLVHRDLSPQHDPSTQPA